MKKRLLLILMVLALTVSISMPALAATSGGQEQQVQPRAAMQTSVRLIRYSASEMKAVVNVLGTKTDVITISAKLQRWNGTEWETYQAFYKHGYGNQMELTFFASPPLGYQYRVEATCTSSTVLGIGYSPILYWY